MTQKQGLLLAAAAYAGWGLLSPGNKILLDYLDPFWLQSLRAAGSFAIVALIAGPQVKALPRLLANRHLVLLSLAGNVVSFGLFISSLQFLDATYTTLGFLTAPLWTALLARVKLGEEMGPWFLPAVAGLLLGAWLAIDGGGQFTVIGMLLAVGAGAAWAVYSVQLRIHAPGIGLTQLMLVSMAVSFLGFSLLAMLFEAPPNLSSLNVEAWVWTFIQIAIPTILSLYLFNAALQRAPAGKVNMLVGMELAATVFFAWILLGDTFSALQLAGLVLVLASITGYLASSAKSV
ncbi:MAG: DMT family transporter [Thermoplasmatota archaeon]